MILRQRSAERAAVAQHNSTGAVARYTLLPRRCYKGKRLVTSSSAVPTSTPHLSSAWTDLRRAPDAGWPTPGPLRPGQGAYVGTLHHPTPSLGARGACFAPSRTWAFFFLVGSHNLVGKYAEEQNKRCRLLSENSPQNFALSPFQSTVWVTVSESIFGTRTQTSTFHLKNSKKRNVKPL